MEYISLKEAQKFCRYSQDYLKLRARQGKLKALKIGRNWVTMKEWVEEYRETVGARSLAPPILAELSFSRSSSGKLSFYGLGLALALVALLSFFFIEPDYLEWITAHIIPGRVLQF